MARRDPQVFDESTDISDGAGLGQGANGDVLVFDAETQLWRPSSQQPYVITTPSGEHVAFSSIDVAREVRYVLNGLTLEGKL